MFQKLSLSLLLAALITSLAGCSNYTVVVPRSESVKIALRPIVNESDLPQIIAPLSRNIREKLGHSANWDLVEEERAEAVLAVTILPMETRTMARDPSDTGRPLSFYEEVRIRVEWTGDAPCPWGINNTIEITSDQLLYSQPSLVDGMTSAIPGIADRLAEKFLQKLDWPDTPLD